MERVFILNLSIKNSGVNFEFQVTNQVPSMVNMKTGMM